MKRVKAQSIGEILREFFAQNPEIGRRLDEVRVVHAWREVLGPGVAQATREAYVRGATLLRRLAQRTDDVARPPRPHTQRAGGCRRHPRDPFSVAPAKHNAGCPLKRKAAGV